MLEFALGFGLAHRRLRAVDAAIAVTLLPALLLLLKWRLAFLGHDDFDVVRGTLLLHEV